MEFESQEHGKALDAMNAIASEVRKLGRGVAGQLCADELREADQGLRDALTGVESKIRSDFESWLSEAGGFLIPYHETDLPQVMELYSQGSPPFSARRSRKDVPDGLVYVATRRLVSESESHTVLITRDGPLRKAASEIDYLESHPDLDEFLRSELMQDLIQKHLPTINFHRLVEVLRGKPDLIQSTLASDLCSALENAEVKSHLIPDDNSEGLVQLVDDPYSVTLQTEKAWDYGDGRMGLPFRALVGADIGFYVFAADYWGMDERESKGISVTQHNDHYLEAEKHFVLDVQGILVVQLDEERLAAEGLTALDLEEILVDSEVEVDNVHDIAVAEESSE